MIARARASDRGRSGRAPLAPASGGQCRRVLLAEDDPALRRMIASVLEGDGYDVLEAGDGLELLARIEDLLAGKRVPDEQFLILTDVNMPGLTGLDVLAILRCAFATTPVILITAFGDREVRAEAREMGAVAVLDKPFNLEELRAVVGRVKAAS